jgi:WD40 repeat protein
MVQFVAWSPDGHRIVIGGDPGESPTPLPALETFDVDTQKRIKIYPSRGHMTALNYSADGKYLLVGWLIEGVEIWDAAHTKLLQRISGRVTAARFSVDGRHLATAIEGDVTIWDMK